MGSRIYNTISYVIMWKIIRCRPGVSHIKGKLHNLHSRKSGIMHKLSDRISHKTKILGNDISLTKSFFYIPKQIHPRALFPLAIHSCFLTIWNGIIFIKASEMINPDYIIKFIAMSHSGYPPAVTGLPVQLPVIYWVSPQLSGLRKPIRRASGNLVWSPVLIKPEKLRVCPYICAVHSYIDWDISYDPYMVLVGIALQRIPLSIKQILHVLLKMYLIRKLNLHLLHRIRLPVSYILRPLCPRNSTKRILYSHK